jgi:hypothetical protein
VCSPSRFRRYTGLRENEKALPEAPDEVHQNGLGHLIKKAGKKTMFLLEGQRHRDEDLENYLENLDKALALPMDHLMFYYSAHEMSPEKAQILRRFHGWDRNGPDVKRSE